MRRLLLLKYVIDLLTYLDKTYLLVILLYLLQQIYTAAGNLCRTHRLRAYDAVQLACALALREQTRANKLPDPIFVCADNNLLSIASAEGLDIDNPNNYPQSRKIEDEQN